MDLNSKRKRYEKWDTGSENTLLHGEESDLEGDIDELMNNSDTKFLFKQENSEKDVSDYQPKNILILKQTFRSLKIEEKIQRIVKKRVKKTELMSLKQKKILKDSQ